MADPIEDELQQQLKMYRALMASVPWPMHLKSIDGRFLLVSDPTIETLGVPREKLIGRTPHEVGEFPAHLADQYAAADEKVVRTGQIVVEESTAPSAKYAGVTFVMTKFPVRDEQGNLIAIGTVSTDITERKLDQAKVVEQRDALAALDHQKNLFLSIVAHDLKGPFNSLLGFSDVMSRRGNQLGEDKMIEYAGLINEAGNRLYGLLENLLAWSRSEMGRMPFAPEPVNLRTTLQRSLEMLAPAARAKGISMDNAVDQTEAFADVQMLDSVIRNLVGNALKFSAKGSTVALRGVSSKEGVEVSVEDHGCGMEAEAIAGAFRLENRLSKRGTDDEMGTGLGLLICKDFVERHGGDISCESTPGRGTIFRFTLPHAA